MVAGSSRCSVCVDERVFAINAALLQASVRVVGATFGFKKDALARHRANHLPIVFESHVAERERLAQIQGETAAQFAAIKGTGVAVDVSPLETPADVLCEARGLYKRTLEAFARADQLGDQAAAMRALREARGVLELFGRAFGMFADGSTTINDHSTKILTVLGNMSEAELRSLARGTAA